MGETCAVCGKKLGGLLGLVSADENELNEYRMQGQEIPSPICHACSLPYVYRAKQALNINVELYENEKIPDIPVYTFNPLNNNEYINIGFISAHIALGTGPFTSILSSIEDLSGEQSDIYDKKMIKAENLCLEKFKKNASKINADAIVGVHVSYTELTAGHGMVMVCMSGTAIKYREIIHSKVSS